MAESIIGVQSFGDEPVGQRVAGNSSSIPHSPTGSGDSPGVERRQRDMRYEESRTQNRRACMYVERRDRTGSFSLCPECRQKICSSCSSSMAKLRRSSSLSSLYSGSTRDDSGISSGTFSSIYQHRAGTNEGVSLMEFKEFKETITRRVNDIEVEVEKNSGRFLKQPDDRSSDEDGAQWTETTQL